MRGTTSSSRYILSDNNFERNEQESSVSLESEQIIPETFLSQLSARELPEDVNKIKLFQS